MNIKQRHELQQDIALYNTMNNKYWRSYWDVRSVLARNMRDARRLTDKQLVRIAATLPE